MYVPGNKQVAIPLEVIKEHPYFKLLTEKQKAFVIAYCGTNGSNRLEAVRQAYGPNTKGVDAVANKLLRHPSIRYLLSLYFGQSLDLGVMTKTELAALVSKRLRDPDLEAADFHKLASVLMTLKFKPQRSSKSDEDNQTDEDESETDLAVLVRKIEAEQRAAR